MAAVIGALRVDLGLNSAEFEQGMKKAKSNADGLGKVLKTTFLAVAAAAAAMTAAFGLAVKGQIDAADGLSKSAQASGVAVEALSALRYAADLSGVSAETLETSLGRLSRGLSELSKGAKGGAADALRRLGISAKDASGNLRAPDAVMAEIAERFSKMENGAAKTALAIEIFGRSGAQLIPMLNSGKAGLAEMTAEAQRLGLVIGTETAQQAEVFNDNLTRLQSAGTGLANVAMAALLPAFVAVTNALVAFSQNGEQVGAVLSTIGRSAAVAGAAVLTAMSPAIWAGISSAAIAMSTTVVGAIKAIGIAIAANPIGLIITALAAAVTAAFLFRDEIKQAIGVDFVGIVQGAANNTIGLFVGAYKAVTAAWDLLPAAFGDIFTRAMNGSIEIVQNGVNGIIGALRNVPGLGGLAEADLSGFLRDESGALGEIGGVVQSAFQEGFSHNYLGELGKVLGGVGEEAAGATANITALGAALDGGGAGVGGGGGAGGAAGAAKTAADAMKKLADEGVAVFDATRTSAEKYAIEIERLNMLLQKGAIDQDTYSRAVLQAQEAFSTVGELGKQVTSTLQSGFSDMFKGLLRGTTSAMDAVSGLLGKLGDLFIDQAFNMLFSGMGGGLGGGGLGSLFGGIGKLFGFARGGSIMPGGSGGIDSQLVAFRKSPNERVDITKPGQTLTSGAGGHIAVEVQIGVENGNLVPFVTQVAGQVAGQQIKQNNKQLPNLMSDYQMRQG